jgi:hypothetical protein
MANILLAFAILGVAFAWSRKDFRVPLRWAPYAGTARPAVSVAGWVILVVVVGDAAANVVGGYLSAPGVHFFSSFKNADAFWLMIALRVVVGLLLGGSLIKMARDRAVSTNDVALPDA